MTPNMTFRARAYLSVRSSMLATLGFTMWATPYGPFGSSNAWAVPMLLCSALLLWSAVWGTEIRARAALFLTVVLGAAWFGGFVAEAILQNTWMVSSLVAWGGLVAIDLIMLRRPLTTPFEELLSTTD